MSDAEQDINYYPSWGEDMAARIAELEAAIRLHRENVWGETCVGHHEDVRLYAVLLGGGG